MYVHNWFALQSFGVENCAVKNSSQLTSSVTQAVKSEQQVLSFAIFEDVNTQKVPDHNVASSVTENDIDEEMDLHPAFTTVFKTDTPNRLMDLSESMKGLNLILRSNICACTTFMCNSKIILCFLILCYICVQVLK